MWLFSVGATRVPKAATLRMPKPTGGSIKAVRNLRTLDEFTEQYFRDHPEEIDDYLTEIFQDYAEDKDSGALLASLRILARVRGMRIMKALGYCLLPQKLSQTKVS